MTLQGCILHDSMCVINFYAWPPTKIFFIFLSIHITSILLTQNINNEIQKYLQNFYSYKNLIIWYTAFYSVRIVGSSTDVKATGFWNWPLTFI